MEDKFTCILGCGHEITWAESPLMPGASLPARGMMVFCPECGEDQEIVAITPDRIVTDRIGDPGEIIGNTWRPGEAARVFYDVQSGSWGYCLYGIGRNGLYCESLDDLGYDSRKAAIAAARQLLNE